MAGGQDDGMKYTRCIKVGSVYQNPWGDGSIPSLMGVRHFLTHKNLSNVPGKDVS
jgi:hypothetical protein